MSTVIEKVTLYDILGYLIPGIVFEILIGLEITLEFLLKNEDMWRLESIEKYIIDMNGVVILILIVLGYCVGIMISELASSCERLLNSKCLGKILLKKLVIDPEVIKEALIKSKIVHAEPTENDIRLGKYDRAMYAALQINDKCKRIHNYVSAKILYRNLMFAAILSVFANCVLRKHGYDLFNTTYLGWIFCISAGIFGIRWIRFYLKCKEYTLHWFIEINRN